MAALNKLAIRGIRSFDDKGIQIMEFYSPLTVIVGHNGSGKTTIIECLKYITTGDLPPNTKGGAFVHDPKIANEKEVKAQVRLRFWNVNRQRMTATRALQVTVKKGGGLTMKTLEGVLAKSDVDGNEGKRNTISTKCSEMDEEVPLLLGVSRAILENVIFCHQEESNWPLSEPAALKKKFDDIFEATKYTKALDNIKALRKELNQELKVDKEKLSHLKQDKDRAERLRKDIEDAEKALVRKEALAEELKEKTQELKAANVQHYAEATGFQSQFEKYESLKERKAMFLQNSKNAQSAMQVMTETTEELEHMKANFEEHTAKLQSKETRQRDVVRKEKDALDDLSRRERNLAAEQGGLKANRRTYERNLQERESKIREIARTHDFSGYDHSPLEDSKAAEFVDKLHELIRRAEGNLRRVKEDGQRKENEIQSELNRLASKKASAQATKSSKQEQIASLNTKIRNSESAFDSVSSLDVEIDMLQERITDLTNAQARLDKEIREAKFDEQIRDKRNAIAQQDAEKEKLGNELVALNKQASTRATLEVLRGSAKEKDGVIKASIASHSAKYQELIGSELKADTMEDEVSSASTKKERELQEAEAAVSANNRTLSQLQTALSIAKQNLKAKKDELSKLQKAVSEALQDGEKTTIKEALDEAAAEVEDRNNDLANRGAIAAFWQKLEESREKQKKCMACDRSIASSETKAVESYIKKQLVRFNSATGKAEIEEEKAQWQAEYDKFQGLLSAEATITELRSTTIPALEKQISADETKAQSAEDELEEAKQKVSRAKIVTRDLQNMRSAAQTLSKNISEKERLQADIARTEALLQASGSLKTADDVQKEIEVIVNAVKTLSRDLNSLQNERELKTSDLRAKQDEKTAKTLQMGDLKGKQQARLREEAALKDLQDTLAILQAELKTLDASAQAAEAPWREMSDQLTRHRNDRANAENDASMQVGIYQSSLGEVESKHRACTAYISEGNDRKIRDIEAQIADLQDEIKQSEEAFTAAQNSLQQARDESNKAENLRSNINANLNFRNNIEDIKRVDQELEDIDIESAAKSRKEFNSKYKVALEQEANTHGQWMGAKAQIEEMRHNLGKLRGTLKSDYNNIDTHFKEQLIKTKVREFANNDLDKYGKALDNAILKYHSIKMDEINDTIGHLWSKTYQGTDIDTIRIVSDHDEASTAARKSYNYRVVMVKNDVELDMRGRCSAGQKVLASIIIRLALAESFGQGCGVLALDEPTTNLDQENINALAEALAEIIRERRRQTNFQLIVITHDEGFLQRLAQQDVVEYYWRVSRDASQKSVLERQRVAA